MLKEIVWWLEVRIFIIEVERLMDQDRIEAPTTSKTDRSLLLLLLLWPPYGIGQAIIFLPCGFFLLLSSIFFLA